MLAVMATLREVLARETARRIARGTVTEEEAARMTLALQRVEDQLLEMAAHYGLERADLRIDLGPLGPPR